MAKCVVCQSELKSQYAIDLGTCCNECEEIVINTPDDCAPSGSHAEELAEYIQYEEELANAERLQEQTSGWQRYIG